MAENVLRQTDRRPLARVADRACSRPGCAAAAVATLSMQYAEQQARLTDLTVESSPERYDLCGAHADRTRPPRGWDLDDDRSDDDVVPTEPTGPRSIDDTVALLAAALHDEPSRPTPVADTPGVPLDEPLFADADTDADVGTVAVAAREPLFADADAEADLDTELADALDASPPDQVRSSTPSATPRRVPAADRTGDR